MTHNETNPGYSVYYGPVERATCRHPTKEEAIAWIENAIATCAVRPGMNWIVYDPDGNKVAES